jgi:uncharacterized membrane protein YphA (DoxX/SURF4 family)
MTELEKNKKVQFSLLTLRLGVFIVFIMWTIDKFVNPEHTAGVFRRFYLIDGLGDSIAYVIGTMQLILVLSFLFGVKKRFTYGAILLFHGISTISTWQMYLDPWGPRNLLFFTAIPMLAAVFTLYNLREMDTLCTFKTKK